MKVKYIRWSTLQQTGERQMLDKEPYDLIIKEQVSGSIAFSKRPKGQLLIKKIIAGEVTDLYIEEFSRLGRDAFDTLTTLNLCGEHDVNVHIQNMGLSSKINGKPNPTFKMFSYIVAVIAEQERDLIKERTEMGKVAARGRGVVFGRKSGSNENRLTFLAKDKNKKILKYLAEGALSIRQIATLTETSPGTVQKVKKIKAEIKTTAK